MPSSIGISPLATAHPLMLHGQWVRSSSRLSAGFNLAMARSPGFGSCPRDFLIILPEHKGCAGKIIRYGLLTLAFTMTPLLGSLVEPRRTNSLAHSSIGTPLPRAARKSQFSIFNFQTNLNFSIFNFQTNVWKFSH